MKKLRWGVLSTARIGIEKVIPAMQNGEYCEITAIASRSLQKAESVAKRLHIPKFYGSYEDLLADPDIDAVYNPLPNHLHVPWSVRALESGKHVLCEKPVGMSVADAQCLVDASKKYPHLKVMEAFMYRFHPQWDYAKECVENGRIGKLRAIQSVFSYYNDDPDNIRNKAEYGGGALMDIGCYNISLSRYLFQAEPVHVMGHIETDPVFHTDRLCSAVLVFQDGTSGFTCSTQLFNYQRVWIMGTEGRIEIEIPFNAPNDRSCRLWVHTVEGIQEKPFEIADQYTLQGDRFSLSVIRDTDVPTPLTDAVANMKVIENIRAVNRKAP
ncbi:Gfo/Idh/MocA family oxidoreductase [bacterium]|nr:Gfo/Idh/MocA family oxidoreductase [bacterium]